MARVEKVLIGGAVILIGLMACVGTIPPSTKILQTSDLVVKVRIYDTSRAEGHYVVRGGVIFIFKDTPLPVVLNFTNAKIFEQELQKAFVDDKTTIVTFTVVSNSTVLKGTASIGGIKAIPVSFDAMGLYELQKSQLNRERKYLVLGSVAIGGFLILFSLVGLRR